MRMKLLMVAFIAALGTMLCSCDKKNDTKPTSSFSFKLDGVQYQSNSTEAYVTDTVYAHKKTLVIDGVTNNFGHHMEMMITFPDSIKAGTYQEDVEMSLMDIQQKEPGYLNKTVKVTITSINSKHAEGTFSGVLISGETEKPLTDGTFKVEIY
ncbi:hypothetical protein [Chitinophaga arvensicola]|uniref:Calycin-like beta-barrel domain-containing protein n=1 Tax=Chitinophaga arvensicola TaxID=29529 RepID=A0A1I0Q0Q0_9BACT|nr:hypothetical protein [Chitinophaga arvensicola]SEW20439.1 hypothetical protein SAMN04488122_1135 [Chitinophaga arvensicola]